MLVFPVLQPKVDTLEDYKRIVVLKGVRSREQIHVSKPNIPNCGQIESVTA